MPAPEANLVYLMIWLDSEMSDYELIYRFFERTLVHERRYVYKGQNERSFTFSYFDQATHHYFENQLANIRHFGLPTPNPSSFLIRDLGLNRIGIYMDDLCLCPECGCFFFETETPYIFDLLRDSSMPFARTMKDLIKSRAERAEFAIRKCLQMVRCAEKRSRQEPKPKRAELIHAFRSARSIHPKSVYLLKTCNVYKIGIAIDVSARIKALQSACPSTITLVKAWTPSNAREREKLLHNRFQKHRVTGEWFDLPNADVEWLTNLEELPETED
jgi:hypothetical protein